MIKTHAQPYKHIIHTDTTNSLSRRTAIMSLALSPSLVYMSLLLSVQCNPWHLDSLKSLECMSTCLHRRFVHDCDHNFCLIFIIFGTWD